MRVLKRCGDEHTDTKVDSEDMDSDETRAHWGDLIGGIVNNAKIIGGQRGACIRVVT